MSVTVGELDVTVKAFQEGKGNAQKQAQQQLNEFKSNPDAWLMVDKILQEAQYMPTKYLGLQVLDDVVNTRWKILPRDQCLGIRNFVVNQILEASASEESLKANRLFVNKLDLTLVTILKQEWPQNWPTFINEIISSCHSSLSVCENNMTILRLLSEEVFDFSAEQLTSTKAKNLKQTMCQEFSNIFQLCNEVLTTANSIPLVKSTLETLLRFLNWIPLGFIFETTLIDTLITRFLEVDHFRNITLKCLTEIGALQLGQQYQYDEKLVQMFTETLTVVARTISIDSNFRDLYSRSRANEQEYILNLAIFLCNFFGAHLNIVEKLPNPDFLVHGHFYLIKISLIDDREIFKICLEYWTKLVTELYEEMQQLPMTELNPLVNMGVSGLANGGAPHPSTLANYPLRKNKYAQILTSLRQVMVEKMVRPEEVLIVENDEGEIVREFVKESDTIQLYKTTRECLVYLTHLDVADTENIMNEKLQRQVDGSEWSWNNCNTLCWAIGSISGAMNEETEKRFLVTVIKDLLGLTEMKRGKDNKAVVASNIMYIVGQYPRFLKAHWKFLKTVVNKLFEFMHESHEGVQDMACDTFIKIANKCKRHFVAVQAGESEPFIDEIIRNMRKITCDLSPQQVHTFYEACGFMISAQGQKSMQDRLIESLMALPNAAWDNIIQQANENPAILQDAETIKVIGNIMKTNVAACTSIGSYFYTQIGRIYHDMLNMYRASSQLISDAVASGGKSISTRSLRHANTTVGNVQTKTPKVRGLRTIKKEILKLVDIYVQKADDLQMVNDSMVPPLLDAILLDYQRNVPDARDAEVLSVVTTIIHKLHVRWTPRRSRHLVRDCCSFDTPFTDCLQQLMEDKVAPIFDSIFECTLDMINKDFHEYPEFRVEFFKLLQAIDLYCFGALLKLDGRQFKLIIDSCMWASKHDNREVENTGLAMCLELINNMAEVDPQTSGLFFQQFYIPILQDVFYVVTDSDHKSGFKSQCMLLSRMFNLVETNRIQSPLYKPDQAAQGTPNKQFVQEYTANLLQQAFGNLQQAQIQHFVTGLFSLNEDPNKFKTHIRDFLISLKEFGGDNADLYAEDREQEKKELADAERERAMKVGGLIKPADLDQDDDL